VTALAGLAEFGAAFGRRSHPGHAQGTTVHSDS
jgi:hypothetical protein